MDISSLFGKINKSSINENTKGTETTNKTNIQDYVHSLLGDEKQVEVKGEVIDVSNKSIQIRVGEQVIKGNVNLTGKLNIGDSRNFLLEIENGRLKLTLVPEDIDVLKNQHIENVLKDLGKLSEENMKLAKMLLESNLPVNKETLSTLKRSIAIFGKDDVEGIKKSLLLLNNDITINSENIKKMSSILNREQNVLGNIKNIEKLISQLKDSDLENQLKEIFLDIKNVNNHSNEINDISKLGTKNLEKIEEFVKLASETILDDEIFSNIEKTLGERFNNKQNTEEILSDKIVNTLKKEENTEAMLKLFSEKNDESGISENNKNIKNKENTEIFNKKTITKDEFLQNLLEDVSNREKSILKSFGVDEKITTPKELEQHINQNLEKLEKALEIIKKSGNDSDIAKSLEKEIATLKDKMLFANELKNSILIQIPFTINNKTANGELIIFKDKRKKNRIAEKSSALISLDTVNLGVFETYLVKKQSNVDIQFRFVNDFVEDLVKNNISQLNNVLGTKNIHIKSITYKKINEAFSMIDEEPKIKEMEKIINRETNPFKFDVRG